MSADIFAEFDKKIDLKGLSDDIKTAEENGGNGEFKDVPTGEYECEINKMEIKKSSTKKPMFSCWMKILKGDYKGQMMFMNQIIEQGFQIHIVNQFLRDLAPDFDDEIEFTAEGGYTAYNDLIMDVFEYVTKNYEYAIKKSKNNKGYDVYYVNSVFDKE
jgi:hypothetical protein